MTSNNSKNSFVGCEFTLYPMSDNFVDIILSALDEVDTSTVWMETDDVSTCIRGKMVHVYDITQAIFLHAAKTGKHVAMSGTFGVGCPCDTTDDVFLSEEDEPKNISKIKEINQKAGCKFALYPMGEKDYIEKIQEQVNLSKHRGVEVSPTHYATRLDGDVKDIFKTLHESFDQVQQAVSHVTMTFTISANSPSNQ
ncbi:YkoF family thiamine/hydroxymethylpyrimidine-binding protein [Aquisalibacillus elongatus]|uniref:YKOF-related protein n=1 Tax=Aquisalibacillus elongatus TaxID=485577 RepID=A0A3N5BD31_9BACI|nr:YkoF family thiamine/hydroxymethylpyrimidine-binding protein [Aquisalibacillus elongatus]RPF53250.1 YKOF-related protein [Aquisalibacillus elongatus]